MIQKKVFLIMWLTIFLTGCLVHESETPPPPTSVKPTATVENVDLPKNITSGEQTIITKSSLENTLPAGVIDEIMHFGGLGGGCGKYLCECEFYEHSSPSLFSTDDFDFETEFLGDVFFEVCGLQKNEVVSIIVKQPDGVTKSYVTKSYSVTILSELVNTSFMIDFGYTPTLPSSPGIYSFVFSGDGWSFDRKIAIADPSNPVLLFGNDKKLTLYKFVPYEKVRLFAYKDGKFLGWKNVTVNDVGNLEIQTTINADFIAMGELSGQVFDQKEGHGMTHWMVFGGFVDFFCEGAEHLPGIKGRENVEILANQLPLYTYNDKFSLFQDGVLNVQTGTVASVKSNPVCKDESFIWNICIGDNCYYVPEATAGVRYLRPTNKDVSSSSGTILATKTPGTSANIIFCSGPLPTRLSVGMSAEVTTSGAAWQLSLRAEPSMSAEKVHVIAAGRDMVILDGPVCADNSYWWYIRSAQGFEGWSREGDHEDYWIDPLQ